MTAAPDAEALVHLDGVVHLGRTLGVLRHGPGDPTIELGPRQVWLAHRTPEGPVTVRLDQEAPVRVVVSAWGPGAPWRIQRAGDLVGAGDPAAAAQALGRADPRLEDLRRRNRGMRLLRLGRVFEPAMAIALGQRVTSVEAHRQWARLTRRHGEPAPGPAGLVVGPAPEVMARVSDAELRRLGVERKRTLAIRVLAAEADRLDRKAAEGPAALGRHLRLLPGIGPWTEGWLRQVVCGDPDAVPVGDFHIPTMVAHTLAGDRHADDARMLELLAPFAGQRGRVVRWVKGGGTRRDRRVPRWPTNHVLLDESA